MNHSDKAVDFLCPHCKSPVELHLFSWICQNQSCKCSFATQEQKLDATSAQVKSFYEEFPFPSYDDFEDVDSLLKKGRKSILGKCLDEEIPYGNDVLEVGCGTGQLTHFLALGGRQVIGADLSLSSLKMAKDFQDKMKISNATFVQMDLFHPCFAPKSFNVVLGNGVLHHTRNPRLAFKQLCQLVKDDGHIVVGLYHRYGRLLMKFRGWLYRRFGLYISLGDPAHQTSHRKKIWLKDQLEHPQESTHTMREVMRWFDENEFDFISAIPSPYLIAPLSEKYFLLRQQWLPSSFEIILKEILMALTALKDGGMFIMVGKKRST